MSFIEMAVIDAVMTAAIDAANQMCNRGVWKFEYDWLDGENIVVNVSKVGGFATVKDVRDANKYCGDIGYVIEKILCKYSKKEWVRHSERFYWTKDRVEIEEEPETDADAYIIDCVQHMFYPVEYQK